VEDPKKRGDETSGSLGVAGWIALVVLAGFLAGAIAYAVHTWNELAGVSIPWVGFSWCSAPSSRSSSEAD